MQSRNTGTCPEILLIETTRIVPFHKSQDTLLHPGLNDQIQNTLFTEDPHETRALWGWFDWLPGSACADLHWSVLVNHIGIHPLPATQPTLIGHALYIKPRPSQFSVPHVACMEMAKFLCAIFNWLKLFYCNGVTSPKPLSYSKFLWCFFFFAQMAKNRENDSILCWDKPGNYYTDLWLTNNILYAWISMKNYTKRGF